MKQVTGSEHDEILQGLKQNWEDAMLQYQCLPVVCDNLYRKHTKERLEAQLKNIERDIELFEKHRMIYVAWIRPIAHSAKGFLKTAPHLTTCKMFIQLS